MADSPNCKCPHTWGWSRHIAMGEQYDLAYAEGKAGGESSRHYHERKDNTFIVVEGTVDILVYRNGEYQYRMHLTPGHSYTVAAGVEHKMQFVRDSRLFEFYTAADGKEVHLEDIVRLTEDIVRLAEDIANRPDGSPTGAIIHTATGRA